MQDTSLTHVPAPALTRRQDYAPPAFWIDSVTLSFDLDPAKTRVLSRLRLRRNPDVAPQPLRLDGQDLTLTRVLLDGQGCSFRTEDEQLVIETLPEGHEPFELELLTTCAPEKNTQLMGLFTSGGDFFTQCEAEGFRRITYFLDRPDVMATYTVTLRADKARWPVLLSNGNLVDSGELEDGRHFATWHDPHPKPSYLFAVVAGKLVAREQRITTRSGGEHLLQVYVRPGDLDQTEHALRSLVHSVLWDEARFGLKLDLERFMVVATSDFNFGAMENKGLNIFNSKYVLAKPATATDADFEAIESVIGHEYFHNWTGNRVTCRDWFQLTLKEGLTVFRDQEFSMDMADTPSARAVKRIADVTVLRTAQFPEDAGPMAHPVRPDAYQEIGNFYTATVYEKGAEIVRLYQTLLGRAGFARGLDLYFERHDGQAVTCDDFAAAMADANPGSPLAEHLPRFKLWYGQAGTPVIEAAGTYDAAARTYTLKLRQHTPATPGQADKQPLVLPVRLGLIGPDGQDLPLQLQDGQLLHGDTFVLHEAEASLVFTDIAHEPVPSLLRGFSAPARLQLAATPAQLMHRLAHDSDPFNRWEAGQQLLLDIALAGIGAAGPVPTEPIDPASLQALGAVLRDEQLDCAFRQRVLSLPGEIYIAEQIARDIDPQRIHAVRQAMLRQLARALSADWQGVWQQHADTGAYRPDPVSAGRRALAGLALQMLVLAAVHSGDTVWPGKAYQRVKDAGNMSDRENALQALLGSAHELGGRALDVFHAALHQHPLVVDKWFALQARAPDVGGSTLATVQRLMQHPDFSLRNPNRARSLIFGLCHANPAALHQADGSGYRFWAEQVLALDALNPQVSARLARALDNWARLAEPWRTAAREAIAGVAEQSGLSRDLSEVITRSLASSPTPEDKE